MRNAIGLLLALMALASAAEAYAAGSTLVRFDIVGTLNNISGIHPPPAGTPSIGSSFSGSFVFDLQATNTNGSANYGTYQTPFPTGVISLKVGDWEWKETGEAPVTILVGNDVVQSGGGFIVDSYHVGNSRVERAAPAEPLGEYTLFQWDLGGASSLFAGANLPRGAFALDAWRSNRWSISNWGSPPAPLLELAGSVTSFQAIAITDLADFNGDAVVDAGDLADWTAGFGNSSAATLSDGDADGDRDVDGEDFFVWQRQLGQAPEFIAAGATVPEPSALALLSMMLLLRRRQRRVDLTNKYDDL